MNKDLNNKNYTIIHCHTEFSNCSTTMDSVTNYKKFINKAKESNMKALAFTEHGNMFSWLSKKEYCEANGLKYIHGIEAYLTMTLDEKVRDNYHIIMLAKNYDGVEELNRMYSFDKAYNREDGHFHYSARITMDELEATSDNIIITSACLGNILSRDTIKKDGESVCNKHNQKRFLNFMVKNKHRCFLEIQHHDVRDQILYNKRLYALSQKTGLRLIAGTDTHSLDEEHADGRVLLQKSKHIHFDNEDGWDLTFKTYDELVSSYYKQNSLDESIYLEAIHNTNIVADMIEEFDVNRDNKYPKISNNPEQCIKEKIIEGSKRRGIKSFTREQKDRIKKELDVMSEIKAIDYMLLEEDLKSYCRDEDIAYGYGRGCFTKDAIVVTEDDLKPLDEVVVGDKVVTSDGKFNKVLDTFEYDISEDMIEFEYLKQGSSYNKFKNICTTDHKILVNRDDKIDYIEAKEIKEGDLLCSPKMKAEKKENIVIDLVDYNYNGYDYDDEYIYEVARIDKPYLYNHKWFKDNNIDISKSWILKLAYSDKNINVRKKGKENLRLFFENTPFKTREDYQNYCKKKTKIIKKIPRYIELDYLWNIFIGLMYGDGWTREGDFQIALAINKTTKNVLNKYVFKAIAKRLDLDVTESIAKNGKNLIQLFMRSEIVSNWIKSDYFISKKGVDKVFNKTLLSQSKSCLKWLHRGLVISDGSINKKENKFCFDNTSLSVINAFKILDNILGNEPLALDYREGRVDERGYVCKDSFKVRRPIKRKRGFIAQDENYWFLPILKTTTHKNIKTKVYDLHIENDHSYMINNIIVHNSVSGSYVAYLLGITDMDSVKYDLVFERFLNKHRISNPDIDSDYSSNGKDKVKDYLYNKNGYHCSEVITFNTIALKGAIRDVGRALEMDLGLVDSISKEVEDNEEDLRRQYPDLFKHVDLLNGVIVSTGSHPAATIVSPYPLEGFVGTCSLKTSERPITILDMREADSMSLIKLDILVVDNIQLIDDTCKLANIERLTPDNMDSEDEKVWQSIRDDTTGIFQWSGSGSYYIKELFDENNIEKIRNDNPNFKYIDLFSMGNGALRPAGLSFRNELANGEFHDNGHEALNEFMSDTRGFCVYQEQILKFLNEFCGFSLGEADLVRKGLAKKTGTEQYLPSIKKGFIETMSQKYNMNEETSDELIEQFLIVIENSSQYGFSLNHSLAYSFIGYANGWLRYYYPLEFLTVALNTFGQNAEKVNGVINYMNTKTNIDLNPIKFGYSQSEFSFDRDNNSIYQGMSDIKFMNDKVSTELYDLSQNNTYENFPTLLLDIVSKTSINSRQLKILTSLNFFSEFGENKTLLDYTKYFDILNGKKQFKKSNIYDNNFEIDETTKEKSHLELAQFESLFIENSRETTKTYMDLDTNAILLSIWNRMEDSKLPLRKQIEIEIEYLGYIETKIPTISDNIYFVTEFKIYDKKKPKPYVNLYNIKEGAYLKTRVDSDKDFIEAVFKLHSIIRINKFVTKPKFKIVDHKYAPTGETHELIKNWEVMQ